MMKAQTFKRTVKPIVFMTALIPFAWLAYQWMNAYSGLPHGLGFNPQETSNRFSGDWALRFLLIGLAIRPLAKITHYNPLLLLRRMMGLFAFFYVTVHLTSYIWLDLAFAWADLWADILKRLYITLGMVAFILLIPLALTSTKAMIKRIGAKRWQSLHRSVYLISILGIIHFIMMRKGLQIEPLIYAGVLSVLLGYRVKAKYFK